MSRRRAVSAMFQLVSARVLARSSFWNRRVASWKVSAAGEIEIAHADFGLQPFSVLGGAIAVAERIPIKFRLVAVET